MKIFIIETNRIETKGKEMPANLESETQRGYPARDKNPSILFSDWIGNRLHFYLL